MTLAEDLAKAFPRAYNIIESKAGRLAPHLGRRRFPRSRGHFPSRRSRLAP